MQRAGESPASTGARLVGRAPSSARRAGEAEVIAAARPIVITEILEILGKDIPDPRAHERYLESLPFATLCARRDQLKRERDEQSRREQLRRQPELLPEANSSPITRHTSLL